MSLAEQLRAANLAYRDPALYDDMLSGDHSAEAVADAARSIFGPTARPTVLDLGCGTGRTAAALHTLHGWPVVGVDIQPELITYARDRYGHDIPWIVGDIRNLALGRDFAVITSMGNTLSYLHTDHDLAAFFRVAYTHSRPGGLLVIATLDAPPPQPAEAPQRPSEITTRYGPATVAIASEWDTARQLLTTTRTWSFRGGQHARDVMTRRIWTRSALATHAAHAGFAHLRRPTPEGLTLVAVRH